MNPLKKLRQENGITQKDLAQSSGISLRTIQRAENDLFPPKGYTLSKLAEAFDLQPKAFQQLFEEGKASMELGYDKLKWINLSGLMFFLIPFSNVFLPIILRGRFEMSEKVKTESNKVVNFQCTWALVLIFSLSISPFIDKGRFAYPLILIVLMVMVILNVAFIIISAQRISDNRPLPRWGIRWI